VIDLNATPEPVVIQMSTFPHRKARTQASLFLPPLERTESLNCTFRADSKIKFGFFRFDPKAAAPVQPVRPGQTRECKRPPLKSANQAKFSPADYNKGRAALYPTGLQ